MRYNSIKTIFFGKNSVSSLPNC